MIHVDQHLSKIMLLPELIPKMNTFLTIERSKVLLYKLSTWPITPKELVISYSTASWKLFDE